MKIGFIGAGNIATAVIRGTLKAANINPNDIYISDADSAMCREKARELGISASDSNIELAKECDCIFLAVKPVYMHKVISEIKIVTQNKCIISFAAGFSMDVLQKAFLPNDKQAILRVMPNTSMAVGQGSAIISEENTLTESMMVFATSFFSALGYTCILPERLFTAATVASGSSPAMAYLFLEAMADGGVKLGLPRNIAARLAAQTLIGAGRTAMTSPLNPSALKDAVCSPAGSTIEAVYTLEQNGFRGAIMEAMDSCAQRLYEMEIEAGK